MNLPDSITSSIRSILQLDSDKRFKAFVTLANENPQYRVQLVPLARAYRQLEESIKRAMSLDFPNRLRALGTLANENPQFRDEIIQVMKADKQIQDSIKRILQMDSSERINALQKLSNENGLLFRDIIDKVAQTEKTVQNVIYDPNYSVNEKIRLLTTYASTNPSNANISQYIDKLTEIRSAMENPNASARLKALGKFANDNPELRTLIPKIVKSLTSLSGPLSAPAPLIANANKPSTFSSLFSPAPLSAPAPLIANVNNPSTFGLFPRPTLMRSAQSSIPSINSPNPNSRNSSSSSIQPLSIGGKRTHRRRHKRSRRTRRQ